MDCRGTNLYCASFPGQAITFSRRHGQSGPAHPQRVHRGGHERPRHRRHLHELAAAALHYRLQRAPPWWRRGRRRRRVGGCQGSGGGGRHEGHRAGPARHRPRPQRPLRMLFEVKSMAFGFTRYKTKWHNNGATWVRGEPGGEWTEKAVTERDQAAAAIDSAVFPAVHPPPMQGQVQRLGGVTAAVIGGFCEHSPVVHEYIAMCAVRTAPDTPRHSTAGPRKKLPHTSGTGSGSGWRRERGANSTKIKLRACPSSTRPLSTRGRSLHYGTPKTKPVRSVTLHRPTPPAPRGWAALAHTAHIVGLARPHKRVGRGPR
jgi:hypothetical protein